MQMRLFTSILILSVSFSCNDNKLKRIRIDGLDAEGNISKDSVYNGLIKFYDPASNKLVEEATYREDLLDGDRTIYFLNGKKKTETHYQNGKMVGPVKYYDSTGELKVVQDNYFDLRVGSSTSYLKGKAIQYYFYSLENKELFHIDYDSIKGKDVQQLNDTTFFFFHYNDYYTDKSEVLKTEIFVYLPNPPGFNFKYSICRIDNEYKVSEVVKEFRADNIWGKAVLNDASLQNGESFAIRLEIDNEFDNDDQLAYLFKRL